MIRPKASDDKAPDAKGPPQAEVTRLHAWIGQLAFECDFLAKAFSRRAWIRE